MHWTWDELMDTPADVVDTAFELLIEYAEAVDNGD